MREYINHIFNEDCMETMKHLPQKCVDIVLTSPFYNTNMKAAGGRLITDGKSGNEYARYDQFVDVMTNDDYCNFTVELFNGYDNILKKDGCVLYNISYGNENSECMFLAIADVLKQTNFTIADCIIWKKKSALPSCLSTNKLTRITEFVFVLCRREEYQTFHCNKKQVSTRPTGQKMYENIFNLVEAANNDGPNRFNAATFSSELCEKLLSLYAPRGGVIYDSFMGTGTTAIAAKRLGLKYIGSEISKNQCDYAENRLINTHTSFSIFD